MTVKLDCQIGWLESPGIRKYVFKSQEKGIWAAMDKVMLGSGRSL